MAGLTDTIKSWYKKDATRPFMYAGTIALGGLALSGGCYIAGWIVEQVSFSINGLRGLHLTNSFRYMIQNPIFWKGVLLFAGIAFVVGTTISIISALGKAITGNSKAIGNSKAKTKEQSKERELELQKYKGTSKNINFDKKYYNKVSKNKNINNRMANTSKTQYKPFSKEHNKNDTYNKEHKSKLKNKNNIYNKTIRDFNRKQTFNKQYVFQNNSKSKTNGHFYYKSKQQNRS